MGVHFEQNYPVTARSKEIKEILRFVTHGQSCQLISVPGAGRSTVLRLLAYHEKLRGYHFNNSTIKQSNNYLFVYLNFAELPSFDTPELTKALFLAMLAAIRKQGPQSKPWTSIGKEIYLLFKEAVSLNDSLILQQYLKKAIQQLNNFNNVTMVFLFDRFSEFAEKTTSEFFTNLRTLRTAAGGKLAIVFSAHRPLEELLPIHHWQDFYEFFVGNHIYLEMYDKATTDFRISVLEKEYGKKLQPKVKEELVRLTGGCGKLMKLSTQIILENPPPQGSLSSSPRCEASHPWGVAKRFPKGESLIDFLLSHILIKGSLMEIWQSLTKEQRKTLKEADNNITMQQLNNNFHLPFLLFSEFIKRNIPDTMIPKTIRFDEKSNDIYFGDDPLEGLTAQEFRLLRFFINNLSRVCERDEIIQAVWSDSKTQAGVSDEALDQMIHRLRKKIEDEADNPKHLLTVKGRGFRFLP